MSSLYITSKIANLAVENPEAANLLRDLDEADNGSDVQKALDNYDISSEG
jgi:hypothetical protein